MQLGRFWFCTYEEISLKKFNIFIGISLGNKFFNKENLKSYLEWAVQTTKDKVLILIADKPHLINYNIFNKYGPVKARSRASKEREKINKLITGILCELPLRNRVVVANWGDIEDSQYFRDFNLLQDELKRNFEFKKAINSVSTSFAKKRKRILTETETLELNNYVLLELPTMLSPVRFDGNEFGVYIYPGESFSPLITRILGEAAFSNLRSKLNLKRVVGCIEAF